MSASRRVILACDLADMSCGAEVVDDGRPTIAAVRELAREAGWSCTTRGDFCPEHTDRTDRRPPTWLPVQR